jgi:hypothetical protein
VFLVVRFLLAACNEAADLAGSFKYFTHFNGAPFQPMFIAWKLLVNSESN